MKLPIKLFYDWFRNTLRNPKYRWWIIIGSIMYLFSPIDIAPDFIPIIGQVDDITILGLLIAEISQLLMERLKAQKPENWRTVEPNGRTTVVEVDVETVK